MPRWDVFPLCLSWYQWDSEKNPLQSCPPGCGSQKRPTERGCWAPPASCFVLCPRGSSLSEQQQGRPVAPASPPGGAGALLLAPEGWERTALPAQRCVLTQSVTRHGLQHTAVRDPRVSSCPQPHTRCHAALPGGRSRKRAAFRGPGMVFTKTS